jgi:hypothetical protein
MTLSLLSTYHPDDLLGDFFRGESEKLFDRNTFQIEILPGQAVFLNNVFDMLVFPAQGFDFHLQGKLLGEIDIEQQQVFNSIAAGSSGDGRNQKDAAVILAALADVDIALDAPRCVWCPSVGGRVPRARGGS